MDFFFSPPCFWLQGVPVLYSAVRCGYGFWLQRLVISQVLGESSARGGSRAQMVRLQPEHQQPKHELCFVLLQRAPDAFI